MEAYSVTKNNILEFFEELIDKYDKEALKVQGGSIKRLV